MTTTEDRTPAEPKYYAVKRHLLDFIGSLQPGSAVPTERSSPTRCRPPAPPCARRSRSRRRGPSRPPPGSGTYVAEPKITWPLYLASFTEQVKASGFTPSAEVLAATRAPASVELAERLELRPRAAVYRSTACGSPTTGRSRSRRPGFRRRGFPASRGSSGPADRCIQTLADHYATYLATAEETIETAPATPREAGPLRVDVGTPMLVVSRRNFDAAGTVVELGRTWFRGDRVTLVTRLGTSL